jgi:Ca-activated chloride channel family protein
MKNKTRWKVGLLAAGLIALSGLALGQESTELGAEKTLSPYFFVESGDLEAEAFPLKSTAVQARVNGVIAEVYVTQTYANEGQSPINAKYIFPASTRASVHGMKLRIGDQRVIAKIREREQAKQEFEAAKSEGKSASLLQQQRPNVFSMSVANIMPGDRVDIELHYTELLVPTEGTYQFMYPTVVGPRYSNQPEHGAPETDRWVKNPYLQEGTTPPTTFDIHVTLSAGLPIQQLSCTSHDVNVAWDGESVAKVALADPSEFGGDRDYILKYRLTGGEIESGLLLHKGQDENFFLLMVQPPEHVRLKDIPPREYIFVLDVSGSMNGFPLDTAKELIHNLIRRLRKTDRFNVMLFAGGSRVFAPSSVFATEENLAEAIRVIERERGGGGTELRAALDRALALPRDETRARTVAVITDGFISGERGVFELIHDNLDRTNFFSFGIGSSVNRYLIEGMAKAGLGEPFVVTKPNEAQAAAERFRRYIESPVLTNIRVRYRGFDAYDVEPSAVPDLFAERPVILFGKWRGETAGEIEISGKTGSGPFFRTFRVEETEPLETASALRYLWARTRVGRLSDIYNNNADTVGEVTRLGLTYNLLTAYTSFVAVIEEVRNPNGGAKDVTQPLPLPLHVSNLAVGGGYASGPEPELPILILIAGLVVLAAAHRRRSRVGR